MSRSLVESQNSINNLCNPLFSKTEITYFAHTRVNKKYKFFGFSSNSKFTDHYLNRKYYNHDIHLLHLDSNIKYIHWDLLTRKGKTKAMYDDFAGFNYGHTFTIIENHDDYKDCYHFAADLNNLSINNKYYYYTELLEKFILYFKEKVVSDKQLSEIYKLSYSIDPQNNRYETEKANHLNYDYKPKSLILNIDNHSKLSLREIECLHLMNNGKTMQEIALVLNISLRTVKAHFEHCKTKLNCKNLFQLGRVSSNLNTEYILS